MKRIAQVVGVFLLLCLVVLVGLPLFVSANSFRPRIESALTGVLGRQVKIGDLKLNILSGGVTADDLSIADDPAFSNGPFVRAKSLKIEVELKPLIFSHQANITGFSIDGPEIVLLQAPTGEWNYSNLGARPASIPASPPSGKAGLDLEVKLLKITDGRVSIGATADSTKPILFEKVNAEVHDFGSSGEIPFSVSAKMPGDAAIKVDGHTGLIHSGDITLTPLEVTVAVTHLDLAASGAVDPALGMGGTVSIDANGASDGKIMKITARIHAEDLKIVKGGSPAQQPVELILALDHDLKSRSGSLTRGEVHIGSALATVTGTYSPKGDATMLNFSLSGQEMPILELATLLPALNIVLPSGAELEGGTATLKLSIEGPTNHLEANGSVGLDNTRVDGFDIGARMSALEKLAGIKSLPGTSIQVLRANVRASQEGGATLEDIRLVVPEVGEIRGGGVVSPRNDLNFKMTATIHVAGAMTALGNPSVPFVVKGNASNPVFEPDVKAFAAQELKNVKNDAVKAATGIFDGVLGKKKK